jgi:acyl-CoA thioesterase FadM
MLASIIDCHGTGSAALAFSKQQGLELKEHNAPRCVTASLQVKYLKPTPIEGEIEIRGKIEKINERRATIVSELFAGGKLCVRGEVEAVLVPDDFGKK